MGTDRTSMTLTDERRRLEDRVRGRLDELNPDVLPDQRWRTTLYDIALEHLLDSLNNAETIREDVPPEYYQAISTRHVKLRYRTQLDVE